MLVQSSIDRYWEKGWVVVDGIFDVAAVHRVRELAMQISQEEMQAGEAEHLSDTSETGAIAPRKIEYPYLKSPGFHGFVTDPRLVQAIRALIGVDPLLCEDAIFMKPPRFGSAKPYHQDNAYFLCQPADHVITAWIALDDVDVANGCLRYIDGSHRGGIIPHEPIPGEPHNMAPPARLIDLGKESLAEVREGGVVFHHSQTLHTSHRNESGRWRRGYATHWVAADVTCQTDVVEKSYFNRPKPR